jgi:hypothetical protein
LELLQQPGAERSAGGIIVFILEWLQADKLRTPQSVERYLGLSVLDAVPTAAER